MYYISPEQAARVASGELLYTLFETRLCGHTVALTANAFVEGSIHWNRSVTDGVLQLGTVMAASLTASIRNSAKLWVSEDGDMVESQYKLWQIEDLQRSLDPSAVPKPANEVWWEVSEHLGVAEAIEAAREAAAETEDPENYDHYGYSNSTLVTRLGVFYIYSLTDNTTQYDLQAYDALIRTDAPVDWTQFTGNKTFAWYVNKIATLCGLPFTNIEALEKYNWALGTLNADFLKSNATYGITTYRQFLGFIAQVFGKVVYMSRSGSLSFGWAYGAREGRAVGTISPSNRFSFTVASNDVKIAGWSYMNGSVEQTVYPYGADHEGLVMKLGENVLANQYLPVGETPGGVPYVGWRDGNVDDTYSYDVVFYPNRPIKYRPFEASILCDLRYDPLDPVALEIVREVDDDPAHDETVTVYSYILENNITINGEQVVRCPDYVNNDSGNESYFTAGENKEINAAAGNVFDNSFGSAFSSAFSAAIENVIQAEGPYIDSQNPQNTRTSGYVQIGAALFQYGWVSLRTTTTSTENFWITMPKHFSDTMYGLSLVPRVGKPDAVSLSEAPTGSPYERQTNQFRVAITRTNSASTGTNTTVFWAAYGVPAEYAPATNE